MKDITNLRVNLENKILTSNKTIVLPHKNLDFDAIGSALGVSLVSRSLDKDSLIIVDDKRYDLDRAVKYIVDDTKEEYNIINTCRYGKRCIDENDLYVLTDVNKRYMIPSNNIKRTIDNTLIIDHHKEDDNTVESNYKFIDINRSSASEIISLLLLSMKVDIPINIANYLLAGIYLDTNKLSRNVSDDTEYAKDSLIEIGANTDKVLKLFEEDAKSEKRVIDLLNNKKIYDKIVLVVADSKDEYTTKELAKTADYGLSGDMDASFAIGRISNDYVGISARSREKIDVESIMHEMGGGGNPGAAAAQIEGENIENITKKLHKILRSNGTLHN